jgi:hypothetical protein
MVKTCAQMAVVGTALVLGGLLTACSGDPGTPGPTSTSATTSAAPTTTTATTTTTTSRNLALPPGVGPFPTSTCFANIYGSGMVDGLTSYYNQVKKGRTISGHERGGRRGEGQGRCRTRVDLRTAEDRQ